MRKLTGDEWKEAIQDCYSSPLSVMEWCTQNDVSDKAFYYWKRRLNMKGRETSAYATQKKKSNKIHSEVKEWASVDMSTELEATNDESIVISIGNADIKVRQSFSPTVLAEIIKTLQTLC